MRILLAVVLAAVGTFPVAANSGIDDAKSADPFPLRNGAVMAEAKLTSIGKVLEVLDSPQYTYLKVSGEQGPLWLAAFKTDINKGATIKYRGVEMRKFYSKSLNRTFDSIIFVESLELVME